MAWRKGVYATGNRRTRTPEEHAAYMREWRRTPKAKEWQRVYETTPAIQTYRKLYWQRPSVRAKAQGWKRRARQRPEYRAWEQAYQKEWRSRPENQTKQREYSRRSYAKYSGVRPVLAPLPDYYPFFTGQEQNTDLVLAVHNLVPPLTEALRRERR